MAGAGGISYYNYADYCTLNNLVVLSGPASGVTVSPSLANLQTRQLAEATRFTVTATGSGTVVIAFDVIVPSAVPNVLKRNGSSGINAVGMFALLGFNAISVPSSQGGTTYPDMPLVLGRLRGYTGAFNTTGTIVYDSGDCYFGGVGDQTTTTYVEITEPIPYPELAAATKGLILPLSELRDRVSGPTNYYDNQPWGVELGTTGFLKAFRVEIKFGVVAGTYVFDVGRLWIGNRWTPQNGNAAITYGMADSSQLALSRDGQAYPQYFGRVRMLGCLWPALEEIEALGYGQPITSRNPTFSSVATTSKCLQWIQTFLGVTRPCVIAMQNPTGNLATEIADAQAMYRNSLYGHPVAWQNIAWLPARRQPRDKKNIGAGTIGRIYTGGVTVQEER